MMSGNIPKIYIIDNNSVIKFPVIRAAKKKVLK
jgi:hypothetical protein